VKRLYQRGDQREDILELFRFIDWIMTLPENLEKRFSDDRLSMNEKNEGVKACQSPEVESVVKSNSRFAPWNGTIDTFVLCCAFSPP
jgi:hypothetical protein